MLTPYKSHVHHTVSRLPHSPPITVERAISKAQDFRHDVEAGVEEPIEEQQPDDVVWHLRKKTEGISTLVGISKTNMSSSIWELFLTLNMLNFSEGT